jgi:hypothetical protein
MSLAASHEDRDCYTTASRNRVGDLFQADVEEFGYDF